MYTQEAVFHDHQTPTHFAPVHAAAVQEPPAEETTENRHGQILDYARNLFQRDPDWITFYREVLGVEGKSRETFRDPQSLAAFEHSDEFLEIQHMLAKLRERNVAQPEDGQEPTRVITVRLPKCLHESLRDEAHAHRTSMNKLCISKLLQIIDQELVPND